MSFGSRRIFATANAMRSGYSVDKIGEMTVIQSLSGFCKLLSIKNAPVTASALSIRTGCPETLLLFSRKDCTLFSVAGYLSSFSSFSNRRELLEALAACRFHQEAPSSSGDSGAI